MAGRTGSSSREGAYDPTEFDRGERDRLEAMKPQESSGSGSSAAPLYVASASGAADMSRTRAASARVGELWVQDPDGTMKSMLRVILGFTVVGGVAGFAVGTWLNDSSLWLTYAKFFFWFSGLVITSMLLGVTLVRQGTRRGTLTIIFLGGTLVVMALSLFRP
jgi:hypothetical protein